MGLFGKLFDKKECVVCGGDIGLLGNRKLEDGNMCKNCAARLSPWFSERRHSTTREIMEQLAYREANYARVKAFVPTRRFGEHECLFMDDVMQTFTITTPNGLSRENPDIVDYNAYVSVKPDIQEHRWEDHDFPRQEGEPPRFKYDYDFYVTVYVNHPYFDDMRFRLNPWSVKQIDYSECVRFVNMTEDVVEAMSGVRPDLMGYIRPYMPEPVPMMRPGAAPMGHPQPAPQGRPMGQPAQPVRPAPQPAPQGRPMGQPAQPVRPAPQPAPQGRPMGQPAQPARPAGQPAQQGRPMSQPAQPARPASQPAQPSRPAGQPAQQGRPTGQPAQPARPAGQPVQQTRPQQQNGGFSGAGRQPGGSRTSENRPGPQGHGGPGRPGGRG